MKSPGGSAAQAALVDKRMRYMAREKDVPVRAFCEDVAAAGGCWLACAADEIFVQPTSIVGSIGVITSGFGFAEMMEKAGLERRVHTDGERTAIPEPFRTDNPDDVRRIHVLQADRHPVFKPMEPSLPAQTLRTAERPAANK